MDPRHVRDDSIRPGPLILRLTCAITLFADVQAAVYLLMQRWEAHLIMVLLAACLLIILIPGIFFLASRSAQKRDDLMLAQWFVLSYAISSHFVIAIAMAIIRAERFTAVPPWSLVMAPALTIGMFTSGGLWLVESRNNTSRTLEQIDDLYAQARKSLRRTGLFLLLPLGLISYSITVNHALLWMRPIFMFDIGSVCVASGAAIFGLSFFISQRYHGVSDVAAILLLLVIPILQSCEWIDRALGRYSSELFFGTFNELIGPDATPHLFFLISLIVGWTCGKTLTLLTCAKPSVGFEVLHETNQPESTTNEKEKTHG